MASASIYLTFNGNCEEAFRFYQSVFGTEIPYMGKFKEMPLQEGMSMSEADGERIMHVSLPIGHGTTIMGSDTGGEWAKGFVHGNNFSIMLNADSKDEADTLFGKLSSGGNIIMPMNQTFWGSYYGMFTDRFGINWMISYSENRNA